MGDRATINMENPVTSFVKYAERVQVKSHTRVQGGKLVHVDAHGRDVDEAEKQVQTPTSAPEPETRSQRDRRLWGAWKKSGSDEDLTALMEAFEPMVQSKSRVYKGKVRIPDPAIDLMYRKTLVEAFHKYDPDKGAALSTYVFRYLDKVKRWIGANQNIGRIPENRLYKIREYQSARTELSDKLGGPPEDSELAKVLGWSEKEVRRMASELRNDLVSQNFEGDPYSYTPSRTEATLRLFKYELSGKEKVLYEHLMGYGRPQITEPGKLAKELDIPGYKVSRMKKSIATKLARYLDE